MPTIQLDKERDYIGKGKERVCYVHPDNSQIAIKITYGEVNKQTKRELKYYRKLGKRKDLSYTHIPRYLGAVETSLGRGHMFDLIRDYDGEISQSLLSYLEKGTPLESFNADLEKLRKSLLENGIISNHDMYAGNILYRRSSESTGDLVVIDGLGDTVFINWLNILKSHRRKRLIGAGITLSHAYGNELLS